MQVKIREAAEIMGVSMDTIRRRLKSGDLDGEKVFEGGVEVWLVTLPDRYAQHQDPHPGLDQVTRLLAVQLEEVQRDRDYWRQMAMVLATRGQPDPPIALGSGPSDRPGQTNEGTWSKIRRLLLGE